MQPNCASISPTLVIRHDGTFVAANAQFFKEFHLSPETAAGRRWICGLAAPKSGGIGDSRSVDVERDARVLRLNQAFYQLMFRFVDCPQPFCTQLAVDHGSDPLRLFNVQVQPAQDGPTFDVLFQIATADVHTLPDHISTPSSSVGSVYDSDAHENAEIRKLFDIAVDGVCVSVAGFVQLCNPAFCTMCGLSADQLKNRLFLDLVHPDDKAATIEAMEKLTDVDDTLVGFRNRIVREDGVVRTVEWSSRCANDFVLYSMARDVTREVEVESHLSKMSTDLSTTKRMMQELEEKEEADFRFLSLLSDEFRTPLSGVVGFLDAALDDADLSVVSDNILRARKCANSILHLVTDLLELTGNRKQNSRDAIDLERLLDEIAESLAFDMRQRDITVDRPALSPGRRCFVCGDAISVRQIFFHLFSAAIRSTKDGGKISVLVKPAGASLSTSPVGGTTMVTLQCSPCYHVIANSGTVADVYGLSFAMAHRYAQSAGATVDCWQTQSEAVCGWVCSLTKTHGSEDAKVADRIPRNSIAGTAVTDSIDALRLLVAEDNPSNQLLLRRLLEKCGYSVDIVSTGREAVCTLKAHDPFYYDCVLMDYWMPELDGLTATQEIRMMSAVGLREMPIVIVTAHSVEGDMHRFLDAGADGYLTKPASRPRLLDAIKAAVNHRKHSRHRRGSN
jgi:PAS domain S-box-containing protein